MATPSIERAMGVVTQVNKIGFVEFTTDLVKNVYNVIVQASMDQLKAYAELVKDVSGSVSDYVASVGLEDTSDGLATNIANYIKDVLSLTLEDTGTKYEYEDATVPQNVLDKKAALTDNLKGIDISTDPDSPKTIATEDVIALDDNTAPTTLTIAKGDLDTFVTKKLQKGAEDTYQMLVTILKLGLQKIVVTQGYIGTKLTFHVDAQETYSKATTDVDSKSKSFGLTGGISGGCKFIGGNLGGGMSNNKLNVTVVNEASTAVENMTADIVGEVRIEFRTESFPSVG